MFNYCFFLRSIVLQLRPNLYQDTRHGQMHNDKAAIKFTMNNNTIIFRRSYIYKPLFIHNTHMYLPFTNEKIQLILFLNRTHPLDQSVSMWHRLQKTGNIYHLNLSLSFFKVKKRSDLQLQVQLLSLRLDDAMCNVVTIFIEVNVRFSLRFWNRLYFI